MATTVELFRNGAYEAIDYSDFRIETGISTTVVAPSARITTGVGEPVQTAQSARIVVDGTTIFEGATESAGTKQQRGGVRVNLEHPTAELWESKADVSLTSPTDEQVLSAALTNANTDGTFTLNYVGTATSLNNDYDVSNRRVAQIFRDMMDRTDRVWWVNPAGTTITVEQKGGRGLWQALDAEADGFTVQSFDQGSVDTVRNDVTVVGTGEEAVEGTATDATSINTYGRRSDTLNLGYATTQAEADAVAQSLLQADPVPEGKLVVGQNVGDVTQSLVNYTVDVDDAAKNISATSLLVDKQVIEQGRAILSVGGGAGASTASHNRQRKSEGDITAPGSVYNSDRLADDSITTPKLVDTAVIESKLADLSVSLQKVQDGAIDTVKITDDAIETPKILAGAVTASEIAADTITANEIAAGTITALEIAADTITANQIAAGTITAAEIDTLALSTNELEVGTNADGRIVFETFDIPLTTDTGVRMYPSTDDYAMLGKPSVNFTNGYFSNFNLDNGVPLNGDNTGQVGSGGRAFAEMNAHNFVTASPPEITELAGADIAAADWYDNPPEHVRQRARQLGDSDDAVPKGRDHTPVELGTMANWLLEACKTQQQELDALRERIAALEGSGGN